MFISLASGESNVNEREISNLQKRHSEFLREINAINSRLNEINIVACNAKQNASQVSLFESFRSEQESINSYNEKYFSSIFDTLEAISDKIENFKNKFESVDKNINEIINILENYDSEISMSKCRLDNLPFEGNINDLDNKLRAQIFEIKENIDTIKEKFCCPFEEMIKRNEDFFTQVNDIKNKTDKALSTSEQAEVNTRVLNRKVNVLLDRDKK